MSPLLGIPLALLGIGLIIAVHEAGHALAARAFRIGVREFAIGFGPVLLRGRLGATEMRLRAIPFGGFVRIAGDGEDRDAPDGFHRAPLFARLMVIVAGVLANVLIAALLVLLVSGPLVPTGKLVIDAVAPDGPAAAAGMRVGEAIIAIEEQPLDLIAASEQLSDALVDGAQRLRLRAADGSERIVVIPDARPLGDPRGQLGIRVRAVGTNATTSRPLLEGLVLGLERTPRLMGAVVAGYIALPGTLFAPSPNGPPLSGPAGVTASIAESAADGGLPLFLLTIALISANIAVLNLLPIPPIDGGRAAGIIGSRIAPRLSRRVGPALVMAGLVGLLGLAAVATLFDLLRAIG